MIFCSKCKRFLMQRAVNKIGDIIYCKICYDKEIKIK